MNRDADYYLKKTEEINRISNKEIEEDRKTGIFDKIGFYKGE